MNLIYSFNKNDADYIILENDILSLRLLALQENFPDDIRNEILNIHLAIVNSKLDSSHKIAMRKDSNLGRYLIQNTDCETIINTTDYISHEKIKQALLISLHKGDDKESNKIWHLFRHDIEGNKEILIDSIEEHILDYILQHSSYDKYREELIGEDQEEKYIIYEDNNCKISSIAKTNKEKVFVKENMNNNSKKEC